jgi:hypothetical protein
MKTGFVYTKGYLYLYTQKCFYIHTRLSVNATGSSYHNIYIRRDVIKIAHFDDRVLKHNAALLQMYLYHTRFHVTLRLIDM